MIRENARKIKAFLKKIVLLNDTPRGIAFGFAMGLFLSVIPTFGLGMAAALVLAPLMRVNLVATYLGTLVVNPLTGLFFYSLDYMVGSWLLGGAGNVEIPQRLSQVPQMAGKIALPLYVGGIIVAFSLSVVSYGVMLWGMKYYKRKKFFEVRQPLKKLRRE